MKGAIIIGIYVVGLALIIGLGLAGAPPALARQALAVGGAAILILLMLAGLCVLEARRPRLARRAHVLALFTGLAMLISMTTLATIGFKQAARLHQQENTEVEERPEHDATRLSNALFTAAAFSSLGSLALFVTIPKPRRDADAD